jgi:hypothetical protein
MPFETSLSAVCSCDMGDTPCTLVVETPDIVTELLAGTDVDGVEIENLPTFGMCMSEMNPEVAAATAAAEGVLTPMPCVPMTCGTWVPGSPTVAMGEGLALSEESTLECAYGGTITIEDPGQEIVEVP